MERITDAFFALDEKWRFTYLNSEAERVLFRTREDLLGKNVWEEFPEAVSLGFYREYHKAMAEQVAIEFEEYYPPLETWFEVKAYPSKSGLSVYFRDVSKRKRAEEALRESEVRYARVAANAPGMFYQFVLRPDASIGFPYVSEGSREVCGIEPQEIQQNPAVVIDMIHPEDRSGFDRSVEASAATLSPWKWEGRFNLRPGEQKWLRGASRPQRQANGDVLWDGLLMDVTERKRAEEALRKTERRLRAVLVQYGSDIIMILEADGTIRYQSPAVERMLGYRPEELVGESPLDYLHPEDIERASDELGRIMNDPGLHEPVEYRFRHKDGSWRHLEGIGNNLLDDPDVRGIVVNSRDVTERKRAEAELRKSEQRFRSLVQNASDIITVLDANGTIRYESPSIERVLGYRPEEKIGTNALDYVHPEDVERMKRSLAEGRNVHGTTGKKFEFRSRHTDGSWRYLEAVGTNLLMDPSVGGIVVNARDVTERKRAEEERLRTSEEYKRIIRALPNVVFRWGRSDDGEVYPTYVEGALAQEFGVTTEQVAGKRLEEMFLPEFHETVLPAFERAFAGETVEFLTRIGDRSFANVAMPFHADCRRSSDEQAPADEVVGFVTEVTQRRRTEEALRRSEARLTEAQRIAHLGHWEWDARTGEQFWSDEVYRIFGYEAGAFVPNFEKLVEMVHPEDRQLLREVADSVLREGKPHDLEHRIVRPGGEVRTVHCQAAVIFDEGDKPPRVIGTVHDVTVRKALEKRLEHQALHDPLTDLPNRTLLADRLEHALARAKRRSSEAAVLFVDLDNFKFVNDSLGHEAGDELLKEAAGRLRACLRPEDTAARLGGDEFAILLEDVAGVGEATRVAERITTALRAPFALRGQEVFVTPSIGITFGRSGHGSPEDLLREADVAMYRAKEEGKARHRVFDPGMEARVVERLRLENDLRRALERDEFEVRYQPVVRVDTEQIIGMEALVRWEHPNRGLVPPAEFVPLAEEIGLIIPIGRRVLREACRQAKEWHEHYPSDPPSIIGVNLSARQLRHPDLVGDVQAALRESGLDPEQLTLEITESAVVEDEEHGMDALRQLGDLGVRFALDDFGTGYSSLSYLKRLPVGLLKIDGSFVERLGEDSEDEVLLSGVVGIATGLGIYVLAEGVETREQLARLKSLGCDLAQGEYFSEPIPSEAAGELLATYYS